jgi:hypothetical protein
VVALAQSLNSELMPTPIVSYLIRGVHGHLYISTSKRKFKPSVQIIYEM